MPEDVMATFGTAPEGLRERLLGLRLRIFSVAERHSVGPLKESLKWGQPAYRPARPRTGTTLRLWHEDGRPALFVPCSTSIIDGLRRDLPGAFDYAGERAILLSIDDDPSALATCIARALTYHRKEAVR